MSVAADRQVDHEWERLVAVTGASLPVVLLSVVPVLQFDYWQWAAFGLATFVVTWGAWPVHRSAAGQVRRGRPGPDALAGLAALIAYAWSVGALLFGDAGSTDHPHPLELVAPRTGGPLQLYFEVAVIVVAAALWLRRDLAKAVPSESVSTDVRSLPRATVAFVPIVLCLAGATAGFWMGADRPQQAVLVALALLAVAAPAAVDAAVPVALEAGRRAGAERGITVGGVAATAASGSIDTVVFGRALLGAESAVAQLRAMGLSTVLLTSAGESGARALAADLPIDVVLPGASATGKAEVLERLRADGHSVLAVAGPGAAHLAAADLAVIIGAESDGSPGPKAMSVRGPGEVAEAVRLAKRIAGVVEGSLAVTMGSMLIAVPAAAFGLVHPLLAAVAGPAVTLFVVANGMRLHTVDRAADQDEGPS